MLKINNLGQRLMQRSILKKLRLYMISFGILMGFIFPVYANFFVDFKEGMLLYFIVGCIAAGITVGVVSYSFVRVILLRPLLKVSEVANGLKKKDISGYIDLVSKDSVGDIVNGINASCENIKGFLAEIQDTTYINEQLLSNVKNLGSNEFNTINTINRSIKTVTEATRLISDHSNQICFTLANSVDSVNEWRVRLQSMNENISELTGSMDSLVKNSEKINGILNMVEDIARRTNLVSINASIEAASAGQYGKGFLVVANEIRDLANNVGYSAKDIARYTRTIHDDINDAGKSVARISTLIKENQDSGTQLKNNLDKIDDISRSNYAADKKLVKSVQTLNSSFNSIEEVIGKLSGNTKNLQKILSMYTY